MRRIQLAIPCLLAATTIACALAISCDAADTMCPVPPEVESAKSCVFRLIVRRSEPSPENAEEMRPAGACVAYSEAGLFVCTYHQIEAAQGAAVLDSEGHQFPVQLLAGDPIRDIAILRSTHFVDGCTRVGNCSNDASGVLYLIRPAGANQGNDVVVGAATDAPVSCTFGKTNLTSHLTRPGDSGSPICDASGALVAVVRGGDPAIGRQVCEVVPATVVQFLALRAQQCNPIEWVELAGRSRTNALLRLWNVVDSDPTALRQLHGGGLLCIAASSGDEGAITEFIKRGVDVNERGVAGSTPLIYALERGNERAATVLMENGANVAVRNCQGDTALILAVKNNLPFTVRMLLIAGADANDVGHAVYPALHAAIMKSDERIVGTLLRYGASVHQRDVYGRTPLIVAVEARRPVIVQRLLHAGADATQTDRKGRTATDIAIRQGDEEIINLLSQAVAATGIEP
jgi:ankyrin repeat protein